MIVPVLLLLSLGITVIFTSTSNHSLAFQQTIFAVIGLIGYLGLRSLDLRALKVLVKPFYILVCILLIVVFVLGYETRGSVRWIPLGFFNLQPSEMAKLSLIMSLGVFWGDKKTTWRNIFLSFLIFLPFGILVFKQPDLGTTLTLGCIWLFMLAAANIGMVKSGILGILGILVLPVMWFLLKDYQRLRFLSFLYPNHDPLGVGYNVIQSTIAVGSGEFWGRGLGRGTQSRLQFLPEFRTDFIFAFIGEELGFIGTIIVLSLYSIIFYLLFATLIRVENRFGELIVMGVIGMLFFQVVVNIGMNIGIMPITGITLPFLSYGGSSIIISLLCLGLAASVNRWGLREKEIPVFGI